MSCAGRPGVAAAFPDWPRLNEALAATVGAMTEAQLATSPGPGRWPLWASVGHLACQRVFWLCDFAGAPGAADSPFPSAASLCPGDDDLEHVRSAAQLVADLGATFAIVADCLERWTLDDLAEEVRHPEWGPDWVKTRGDALQRVYAHDVTHVAELNDALRGLGLEPVDLWP